MGVIAEFSLGADALTLSSVVGDGTDVRLRFEPVVPTSGHVMPYVWVSGDVERFDRRARESDDVDRLTAVENHDDRRLYRVHWSADHIELLSIFVETNGALLEATADERWQFTVRFPDDSSVTRFHERSQEAGYELDLHRLGRPAEGGLGMGDAYELTPAQREALVSAVENGYFDIPRGATLDDIADAFDISNQAASERIRRATETVLRQALTDDVDSVAKRRT